jgi:hypothetical protein
MRVELNESNDNLDQIEECATNDECDLDQASDEPVFDDMQKAMQKNNDYYYKRGILDALDDAILKINLVDGRPQFQILHICEGSFSSVCKTLNNKTSVWTNNELSCNLTLLLEDQSVTFIPEGDSEPEIFQYDPR